MNRMFKLRQSKAFSLIELLLILAVIAALIFAGARIFVSARNQARVAETMERLNVIVDASYRWLGGGVRQNFCGYIPGGATCPTPISNQRLKDAGLLTRNQLLSPWPRRWEKDKEEMEVSVDPEDPVTLVIRVPNVPTKMCAILKHKMSNKVKDSHCGVAHDFYAEF